MNYEGMPVALGAPPPNKGHSLQEKGRGTGKRAGNSRRMSSV